MIASHLSKPIKPQTVSAFAAVSPGDFAIPRSPLACGNPQRSSQNAKTLHSENLSRG